MTTIYKMLDVSTAHISRETDKALSNPLSSLGMSLTVSPWGSSGFIIAVPSRKTSEVTTLALQGWRSLAAVLARAQELECGYVQIYGDGEVLEGLETYNW